MPQGRPARVGAVTALSGLLTAGVLAVGGPAGAAPTPASTTAATTAPDDELASRFTLAVLPDTQFYSRYATDQFVPRYGDDPFHTQTAWLAEHADDLDIPFVTHLGDVVDRAGVTGEWEVADRAMSALEEGGVPYSVLPGNHDVLNSSDQLTDVDYDLGAEPFLKWFGPERAASQSTYGGSDPTGMNQYHVFEAEGQEFMVLALTWRASDQTIAWADQVMAEHPDVPVVLTTHSMLAIGSDATSPEDTPYGEKLWNDLVRSNDQIFLTLNGHSHGATKQTRTNDAGNTVTQVLIDYQMAYDGGNGYLGLFEFDLTHDRIEVQTASPWVVAKDPAVLTAYDQPFLTGEHQQYTIDIDFSERFDGFAPGFTAGEAHQPSLSQRARDLLLEGFEGPDPITTEPPASRDDYPQVDGTLAHWRFGGLEGVVDAGTVVPDIVSGADLVRASSEESGSTDAEPADVVVSHDAAPLSSDGAAVCFANADRTSGRLSYLRTEADAAVNDAELADGYTIETFLKIDESFTEGSNAWMKAITRSGNRSTLPGMPWSRWDYTASPVALGLSNLRELQWTEVPVETTKGDRTSWSGEIILDRWVHVALVNDPTDRATTMYVDGAPVLRNATDTLGHSLNEGMPWLFGTDWVDDRATNGWNGCIGETRVVDHPTGPEQWLTARAAEPAPESWEADTVYDEGDRVTHDSAVFEATWWTRNQAPGTSVHGPWQEIATAEDGTAVWTPSRIFDAGDVVVHDGRRYEARWWTRNQAPGASSRGPWQPAS
ncbi:metallophosphoesterase [Isoptericola sp. S6320L]|uniref:carbohydrate-binding protein n=1 Tax=Isoptericola sp. S6320L TaxID=2926411 RepID=UPI001FF5CE1A|nr:carbohydrate-binding protein [Isoptericola sp. S6320L]MCK0117526.1 metallophosphoesterase [Isoptericola sp. S6320L]